MVLLVVELLPKSYNKLIVNALVKLLQEEFDCWEEVHRSHNYDVDATFLQYKKEGYGIYVEDFKADQEGHKKAGLAKPYIDTMQSPGREFLDISPRLSRKLYSRYNKLKTKKNSRTVEIKNYKVRELLADKLL